MCFEEYRASWGVTFTIFRVGREGPAYWTFRSASRRGPDTRIQRNRLPSKEAAIRRIEEDHLIEAVRQGGPLALRDAYEEACRELGVEPMTDGEARQALGTRSVPHDTQTKTMLGLMLARRRAMALPEAGKVSPGGCPPIRYDLAPVDLIGRPLLKERGWMSTAIKRFLGKPDATRPNPRFRNAAPMQLFRMQRVLDAEASEAFQSWLAKRRKRREAGS